VTAMHRSSPRAQRHTAGSEQSIWWRGISDDRLHSSAAIGVRHGAARRKRPCPPALSAPSTGLLSRRVVGCGCGLGTLLGRPAFQRFQPRHGPERLERGPRRFDLGTLLGYPYSWLAVGAILTTAVLGLIVSLSTFLVIGATSSVTFNVVRDQTLS